MRLRVRLGKEKETYIFSWNYYYAIASSIYNLIAKYSPKFSFYLHYKGWSYREKNLKLFSFSPLFPKRFIGKRDYVLMEAPCVFLISSPDIPFIELLDELFRKEKYVIIEKNQMPVLETEIFEIECIGNKVRVRTLSPITVSEKLKDKSRVRSVYLSPESEKFTERLRKLLFLKYAAFTGEEFSEDALNMKILNFSSRLIKVKNVFVKGYTAEIEIESSPRLLRFAIDSGLGEKTSMGFGMVEKI